MIKSLDCCFRHESSSHLYSTKLDFNFLFSNPLILYRLNKNFSERFLKFYKSARKEPFYMFLGSLNK